MTRRAEPVGSSYQVTLRGRFGPSFLAAFTAAMLLLSTVTLKRTL